MKIRVYDHRNGMKILPAEILWCEELFAGGKAHYLKPDNTLVFYN